MKKQSNSPGVGRKLSLNKKTISNLNSAEMNHKIGGTGITFTCRQTLCDHQTCHGNNCPSHKC